MIQSLMYLHLLWTSYVQKESLPHVIAEEICDTVIRQSDHECVACEVTHGGDEVLKYKTNRLFASIITLMTYPRKERLPDVS